MKTIAIIGGMGPQASTFAQQKLIEKLKLAGKRANIVHVCLDIEPFFASEPVLSLSERQKRLLWRY